MEHNQKIRPSQFIYNYGPGAILETKNGPRMIPSPNIGLFYTGSPYDIDKYSIEYDIKSVGILEGGRIFRLPTNAEIGEENRRIYKTSKFPTWYLCMNSQDHSGKNEYVLHKKSWCPECNTNTRQSIISFVVACPNGHLDEVWWEHIAHNSQHDEKFECKNNDYFIYHRGTGNISTIRISCPKCGCKPGDFGRAYSMDFPCTGRYPEMETGVPHRPHGCERKMKIIQRQASSLRIPEIKTMLELKFGTTSLERTLDKIHQSLMMSMEEIHSKETFMKKLKKILDLNFRDGITPLEFVECEKCDWPEIKHVLDKIKNHNESESVNYSALILNEYKELREGSRNGVPAASIKSKSFFEMKKSEPIFRVDKLKFMISVIPKLSVITVQHGYRREIQDGTKAEDGQENPPVNLVKYKFKPPNQKHYWYPGMRSMGEGLFIMLGENDGYHPIMKEKSHRIWSSTYSDPPKYDANLFRNTDSSNRKHEELHPVFVWWHTLSHALIRVMGDEVGYSSTAIRERVFVERIGDRARGGILLYAAQAGNEGSLGGLISMAPHIRKFINRAMERIDHCSGDPLCSDYEFRSHSQYNGAACYGCTMNSETSCEHRNMWLDRHILMENPP